MGGNLNWHMHSLQPQKILLCNVNMLNVPRNKYQEGHRVMLIEILGLHGEKISRYQLLYPMKYVHLVKYFELYFVPYVSICISEYS